MAECTRLVESIGDKRIKNGIEIINESDLPEIKKVELIFLLQVLNNINSKFRSTGKKDMSGREVVEGDVIGNPDGVCMKICYGTYEAYCPVDQCFMENVGFYATGKGLPDMPIGNLEDYAVVIGNVNDDPDLEVMLNE